jgi:hypothetical protein
MGRYSLRPYARDELTTVFGDAYTRLDGDRREALISHVLRVADEQDVSVMLTVDQLRQHIPSGQLATFADLILADQRRIIEESR